MANKSTKKTWIKYGIILAIAIVLLIISQLKNKQFQQQSSAVFDFNKNDITEIGIYSPEDTVSFRKLNDTTWTPVVPDTGDIAERNVDRLLSSLLELKQTGIATEDPEDFSTYNISDDSASKIKLKKGDNILNSFYIALSRSSRRRGYLRFADENKVYRIDQNLTRTAQPNPEYWQE